MKEIKEIKEALANGNFPYHFNGETREITDEDGRMVAMHIYKDEDVLIFTKAPQWLYNQQELIVRLERELFHERKRTTLPQNHSLELAVKALEEIQKGDDSYHTELSEAKRWIDKVEDIAESTLDQIRRTET